MIVQVKAGMHGNYQLPAQELAGRQPSADVKGRSTRRRGRAAEKKGATPEKARRPGETAPRQRAREEQLREIL